MFVDKMIRLQKRKLLRKISLILIVLLSFLQNSMGDTNFVDNGNNTISDTGRHLIWQKSYYYDSNGLQRQEAINYCINLDLAGFNDWRLPHVKELISIHRYNTDFALDRALFPTGPMTYYWFWTSSIVPENPSYPNYIFVGVTHDHGQIQYDDKFDSVRCVRSGR
jgi:hypothetical protein